MPALPVQQWPPPDPADDNDEPMELDVAEAEDPEDVPVFNEVQLDLESHIGPYTGPVRVQRLEFIADHCNSLRAQALKMALDHIQESSLNVKDYVRLGNKYESETGQSLKRDMVWVEMATRDAASRRQMLEAELKKSGSCYIKEAVRRAYDQLGDHHLDTGELDKAHVSYSRALDNTISDKNQVNQCLSIIRVNILLKRWPTVSTYVLRAQAVNPIRVTSAPDHHVDKQLQCAAGLCELNLRRYKSCARHLLSTNFDDFEHADSNLLAPVNILTYGGLCALATYSRAELACQLINSASFRQFAELDTQLRDAIHRFYESRYGDCLDILQDIKSTLSLDLYLAPHVDTLITAIRNRALVQYFEPYSSACLRKMAASFADVTLEELEKQIVNLICDGQIRARIDSHHKILYASKVDSRSQIFERALTLGKNWQRQAHAMISRTAILNAGLRVGKRTTITD